MKTNEEILKDGGPQERAEIPVVNYDDIGGLPFRTDYFTASRDGEYIIYWIRNNIPAQYAQRFGTTMRLYSSPSSIAANLGDNTSEPAVIFTVKLNAGDYFVDVVSEEALSVPSVVSSVRIYLLS